MAKKPKRQLSPERKELISKLIDEFDPKSVKGIEDVQGYVLSNAAGDAGGRT